MSVGKVSKEGFLLWPGFVAVLLTGPARGAALEEPVFTVSSF